MSPEQFIQFRKSAWEELSSLLEQSDTRYSTSQVTQIGRLYRATSSDLALAQRDFPYHDVTHYLNQLVARSHAVVYRSQPFTLQQIRYFLTHLIPQTYRANACFILIASLLLFLPAIYAGIDTWLNPDNARLYIPVAGQGIIEEVEEKAPWFYFEGEDQPIASAMITTNNIRVSILAFAGGMTAGIYTLFVMIQNGFMLGSLLGLASYHEFFDLWNFVIAHGVIELSVIGIAGGAGLVLTNAMLNPGKLSRVDAIYLAGRQALILLIGAALMLIVAGLIEGFISPREFLPPPIKWGVGIGSGILMY
ncbi:MAG: stage II sporulation protein M, partial [Candidatus Promineifilaceae bacterium]